MYRYILNQFKRTIIVSFAFCTLLALTGMLLRLGAALLMTALGNVKNINGSFTTIAMPDTAAMRKYALNKIESENMTEYKDITSNNPVWGEKYFKQFAADRMTDEILSSIEESVYGSDEVEMDSRRYFGAYSPGIVPVLSSESSSLDASSATFVVTCTGIEEVQQIQYLFDDETGEQRWAVVMQAYVDFDVNQIIMLHPDIQPPDTLWVNVNAMDAGGKYFFEEGKTYFVSGSRFSEKVIKSSSIHTINTFGSSSPSLFLDYVAGTHIVKGSAASVDELSEPLRRQLESNFSMYNITEDNFPMDIVTYQYNDDNQYPYCFPLEADYQDALQSEIGADLKYAVSLAEKDVFRCHVFTTDNLYSYFRFNQYQATIEEGRSFTVEETINGTKVCVLPSNPAKRNNLSVGDTITLNLTEGQFGVTTFLFDDNPNRSYRIWRPGGYYPHMEETEPIVFEIIGIYNTKYATENTKDPHVVPINVVFIPDNSFEGFIKDEKEDEQFINTYAPGLNPMLNAIP